MEHGRRPRPMQAPAREKKQSRSRRPFPPARPSVFALTAPFLKNSASVSTAANGRIPILWKSFTIIPMWRVDQILRDARDAMDRMGRAPARFLERHSEAEIGRSFHGFCHRWTKGEDMAALLAGIRGLQRRHGSLGACFRRAWNLHPNTGTVHEALIHFVRELKEAGRTAAVRGGRDLLPEVQQGGASKRLHLFLRWMIRSDEIDPGGWEGIPASALIIPLDTHMHRIGRALGFTRRRQTDAKTAEEITAAFRQIAPEDPVRYDLALTRLGIHPDASAPPWLRL